MCVCCFPLPKVNEIPVNYPEPLLLALPLTAGQGHLIQHTNDNGISKPNLRYPAWLQEEDVRYNLSQEDRTKSYSRNYPRANCLGLCVCVISRTCFEIALNSKVSEVLFLHGWIMKPSSPKIKGNMGRWEWAERSIWIANIFVTD